MKSCAIILGFCLLSAFNDLRQQQRISTTYYRDFDKINVKGIGPMDKTDLSFPYVELIHYPDNSLKALFHIKKGSKYWKNYKYINQMLVSKKKMPQHDGGCLGFTEVQYYFEFNKMITYQFCGKKDTYKKEDINSITTNEWINDSLDYVSKTFYSNMRTDTNYFTFNPGNDYQILFSSKGTHYTEYKRYRQGDSVIFEENRCTNLSDNTKKSTRNYYWSKPFVSSAISIWPMLKSYERRFPPF